MGETRRSTPATAPFAEPATATPPSAELESAANAGLCPSDLRAVGCAFRRGAADLPQLRATVDTSTLYALRPATPGLVVFDLPDGGRWVVVFTTLNSLARFVGARCQPVVDWLRSTGADLVAQLPVGVGLLVDPGANHSVALCAGWLG